MTHKYPLTVLLLLIFVFGSVAQQTTFQADYSFGSFDIPILLNIIQNPSGQYIMTGTDGTLPIRGTITELDSSAHVVFSKEYVSSIETEIVDVKNVPSGGYIVAGASNPGLVLMRLDANANVIWSNTYHVGGPTEENASRVLPTSDHGFVVAGYVYEATPPGGYARQDSANCYALKVDSNGNLLWAKVIFCSVAYINDHLFNDVAEDATGYVFVGSMSEAHSDNAGTYGLVVKTDFNGNVQYMKHWGGASSTDAEATSIITTGTNAQLVGGDDNSQSFFFNFNSSSGTGTGYKYGNGILPPYLNFNAVQTYDGNVGMVGMAPLGFESYLMKVNSSTGAVIWGEEYNGGFASILPEGRQVSDSGFIMVTTALGTGGYEYLVVKTNSSGTTSPAGCTPTSFSPSKSAYSPTYTSFPLPDSLVGSATTSFSPTILTVTPSDSIHCIQIVCTPPAAPSALASPSSICSGSSSSITGSGGGSGAVYNVYAAATGGTSLGTTPLSVSPTTTTTYYVDESSTVGCTSTTRTPVTVTVTQAPGAAGPITGQTAVCNGNATYTINAVTSATSYSWSLSGGGNITSGTNGTSITVDWTTPGGPYTITVTASNSCGNSIATIAVNVSVAPTSVTATANPNPACAGNNVALNATSANATTWSWSGPNSYSSSSQNPTITAIQASQAGTYTITASNNCGTVTGTVSVVVNAAPGAATAGATPNPVCAGQNIGLSASSSSATTWAWSGPNSYTSSSQNPTINAIGANGAGIYTVTASNTCGSATASVNVTVNTPPTAVSATASSDTVCVGSTLTLIGSATNATTYNWSGPNGFTSTSQSPSISNITAGGSGVYTLSAGNSCGNTTATVSVSVITSPTAVSASASTTLTCFNTSVNFTGTATGATSYSWSGPNGFTSNQQNPSIPSTTVADSGTYIFTATNTCGSNTASVTVNVDTFIQNLTASVSPNDTLCTGSNITLHASGVNVNTWAWTGPNGYTSAQPNPVITGATTGSSGAYIVTATNACGSVKDTVHVFVESSTLSLTASSNVANDSACSGAQVNLIATGSNFDNYLWTGPNGFISTHQDTSLSNVTQAQTGYYVVTGNNSCGTLSDSVLIHIDSLPTNLQLSTNATNNATCQGQSITVSASSAGITQWSWTGPAGFTSNAASFTITNPQPNQQGLYIVTATNSCGSSMDSVDVTVLATPDTLTVSASSDSICPGASITLTASGNLTNVVWSTLQTGNSITISTAGTYYYTATNSNACAVHSDTITVQQAVPPVLNLFASNPNAVCEGQQPITLHSTSDPNVTVTWYPGGIAGDSIIVPDSGTYVAVGVKNGCTVADTITVSGATVPTVAFTDTAVHSCCLDMDVTPVVSGGSNYTYAWSDTTTGSSVTLSHTGNYTVTVTTGAGCSATGSVSFNKVCLGAVASALPDTIYVESTSQLNVTTTVNGHLSYMWSPPDSVNNPNIPNPSASPKLSTLYTVVVTDSVSGCSDTSSAQVTVLYNANFGIPNVFSPKVAGPNDHWYVINQAGLVTVEDIKIFDRWGEMVFGSERDGSIEWDGNYQGKLQPMGNYVYMVQVKINATGEVKRVNGNLALIW